MADHLIGYSTDTDPVTRYAQQPWIGEVSDVCEMFGCLPDGGGALDQDPWLVQRIAEYRAARAAADLYHQGPKGVRALMDRPPLVDLLLEMLKAQLGQDVTADQVVESMHLMDPESDESE